MPDLSFRDRPLDTFLSHAHADKAVVDRLHAWLLAAGLKVWYDATHLPAGARIATELGRAIPQCRSAIVVMSASSVASGWVEEEWNLACEQRNSAASRAFRVIPVRVDDCTVPAFLKATKWVDLGGRMDDLSAWADLLDALADEQPDPELQRPIDLYLSRSWQPGPEQALAEQVVARLRDPALRLIGDSPDWPSFSGDRIRSIMRSCAGVVAIIPKRPRTADKDRLKYFIHEARTARQLGLPLLLVAEQGADLPAELQPQLRAPTAGVMDDADLLSQLDEAVQDLLEACRARPRAGHVFVATPFDAEAVARSEVLRRVIQRCTGLRCIVGKGQGGDTVHESLIESIRQAIWVLADISENRINTCIEAGMALGARVDCTLVARKPYLQQPFMLRGKELESYDDAVALLAIAHRHARAYRRKVYAPGVSA